MTNDIFLCFCCFLLFQKFSGQEKIYACIMSCQSFTSVNILIWKYFYMTANESGDKLVVTLVLI